MARLHLCLMLFWAATLPPTLLWWRDSVAWVAVMSWYALVVGHWSSFQAARAEEQAREAERHLAREVRASSEAAKGAGG